METMVEPKQNLAVYTTSSTHVTNTDTNECPRKFWPGRNLMQDRGLRYASGFMMLSKYPGTVQFVHNRLEATSTFQNINDAPNVSENYPFFKNATTGLY